MAGANACMRGSMVRVVGRDVESYIVTRPLTLSMILFVSTAFNDLSPMPSYVCLLGS